MKHISETCTQAMVDILADAGWLSTTLHVMNLMQMLMQV